MSVQSVKLVCAHGVQDGTADFLDRFRLLRSFPAARKWVPTDPHGQQQLEGDEPITWPASRQVESDLLRDRYDRRCDRCGRTLQLRQENLQALLNAAADQGLDTLYLDNLH
ncbi:hypothetical protein A5633_03775 [Mycolicibacterium elephantis]|nr:hypothetical protein A5633_03775 [Mycolicibacterium elephantis]